VAWTQGVGYFPRICLRLSLPGRLGLPLLGLARPPVPAKGFLFARMLKLDMSLLELLVFDFEFRFPPEPYFLS
jgi:hypothetical protein